MPFNNFPVEFKEINPTDFTQIIEPDGEIRDRGVFTIENNNEKIIIEPDNETGYINDVLQPEIDIHHKNTVVINASVGNGKSYSIIQTIKRYFEDDSEQEYLIMVASPYTSLVQQYVADINTQAGIPLGDIYSYNNIGRNEISYTDKKVHVITVNTLIGNPGENKFRNSSSKRNYLNNLQAHCLNNNIKVVFIYDEIHASYYNFKEKFIFNLWKWKDLIHKNFVVSATYNEASKVVIEYLAELTSKRIKIIESKRIRIPEKQSDLFLHFTPSYSIKEDNPELIQLIDDKLNENKNIDILCFSKNLSRDIVNSEVGLKLSEQLGGVKLCVSDLGRNNQRPESNTLPINQFDGAKCNIGTNFSTGVSIRKENHAFIIILPSRSSRAGFKNEYGIFSDGINSIVQALARQRVKGEIHVLLYNPDKFDFSSLEGTDMNSEQKENFIKNYSELEYYKIPKEFVTYKNINNQNVILKSFYELLKSDIENEISHIENLDKEDLPPLSYPSLSRFQLEKSSDYFASEHPLFGKDISASLTYLALTNQLINCKLRGVFIKPKLYFTIGNLQSGLHFFYKNYINPHDHEHYLISKNYGNFSFFYHDIRDDLFNNFRINIRDNENSEWKDLQAYKARLFEIEFIKFCYNIFSYRKFYENSEYARSEYFLDSISIANSVNLDLISDDKTIRKVSFYRLLNDFREQIIAMIEVHIVNRNQIKFLPKKPKEAFYSDDNYRKLLELEKLIDSDILLNNDVFKFKRNIIEKENNEKKLNSLYTIILKDFFESIGYRLNTGNRERGVKVLQVKSISRSEIIDLINLPSIIDGALPTEEDKIEHFGSTEEYEIYKNELLKLLEDL